MAKPVSEPLPSSWVIFDNVIGVGNMHLVFLRSLGPKLTFYQRCSSGHINAYKLQPAPGVHVYAFVWPKT